MLDDLIYNQPGHLIRRAHQQSTSVFMEKTKAFDLTPMQYGALAAIGENPGVDATRLSEIISYDRATVGNVLDRLEKKELLTRKPHATDRRTKENFLTPQGRQLLKKISKIMPDVASATFGGLNQQERRQLMRLLARLLGEDG